MIMIRAVQGDDRGQCPALIDEMFRGRAAVFRDKLHWDVQVQDGWEVDRYDGLNPLYLISVDADGHVRGSLRLMPTTGPTLLGEVFAHEFDEPVDIRSATIWEGTRFCVHPHRNGSVLTSTGVNLVTSELFMAMCEVGLAAGLTQIIGVYDPRLIRIYRRIGWSPEQLAMSTRYRTSPIYVGLWDISETALATMRDRSGMVGSVLQVEPSLTSGHAA